MKILLDAMGGDYAPLAAMEGAARAVKELGVGVVLCGDENRIRALASEKNIPMNGISVVSTPAGSATGDGFTPRTRPL